MRLQRRSAVVAVVVGISAAFLGSAGPRPARALEHDRQAPGQACTKQLVVPRTNGADGCWIDEHVTAQPGTLSLPCDGRDGDAQAVFGDRHFTGQVRDGRLHLVLHTQFHFSDGCNWGTNQTIDGDAHGAHLAYGYQEFPLHGQHGCASACTATGDVRVH